MASPRVYYAMARDGLFFSGFAAVDPRRGTPARAIAIQATLAAGLTLTGSFEQILDYFIVPTLIFLAMTLVGVFVLQRRSRSQSSDEPALVIPGYPGTVLLALVPILLVIVLRTLRDPYRVAIGLAVVVLGVPVSMAVMAKRRTAGKDPSLELTDL